MNRVLQESCAIEKKIVLKSSCHYNFSFSKSPCGYRLYFRGVRCTSLYRDTPIPENNAVKTLIAATKKGPCLELHALDAEKNNPRIVVFRGASRIIFFLVENDPSRTRFPKISRKHRSVPGTPLKKSSSNCQNLHANSPSNVC